MEERFKRVGQPNQIEPYELKFRREEMIRNIKRKSQFVQEVGYWTDLHAYINKIRKYSDWSYWDIECEQEESIKFFVELNREAEAWFCDPYTKGIETIAEQRLYMTQENYNALLPHVDLALAEGLIKENRGREYV